MTRVLNNALNEILNGLDLREFHTRTGATCDEAQWLLDQIHAAVHSVQTSDSPTDGVG